MVRLWWTFLKDQAMNLLQRVVLFFGAFAVFIVAMILTQDARPYESVRVANAAVALVTIAILTGTLYVVFKSKPRP
jgi:hypothetical protein